MPESLLSWNEEKGKFEVEITNRKGEKKKIACEEAELSAELPKTLSEEPLQVEFERNQHGDPIKIRPAGKEWIAPQHKSTRVDYSRKDSAPQFDQTRPAKAKDAYSNRRGEEIEAMTPEFHNPYNFVPAPERVMQGDLADAAPCGHDRYCADKYSGKLHVRMRVETPLLLPDAARMSVGDKEHKSFPVRVRPLLDEQGKEVKDVRGNTVEIPDINPTAIKGMLRSAYEAVTNSRFAVFQKHNERLAFRMDAKEGLQSVPAMVRLVNGGAEITLLTGTVEKNRIETNGTPSPGGLMYAAWLLSYGAFGTYRGTHGKHGEEVWAYIVPYPRQGRFRFWNVEKLEDGSLPQPDSPPALPPWVPIDPESQWVKGYVCITNKNIENKHDERVFFNKNKSPIPPILVLGREWKRLKSEWKRLLEDYAETDHSGKPDGVKLSRHILNIDEEKALGNKTLCYARVEQTVSGWYVKELIPVMISRRLHEVSPAELLPEELHPAQTLAELSPADRVFGWVRQPNEKTHKELMKEDKKLGAYRGQIRLGVVELVQNDVTNNGVEKFAGETLPLQILGQPKPQQGRFYVARDKDGNAQRKVSRHESGLTNEAAGYNEPARKGLRGRKVYPHHNLPDAIKDKYWQNSLSTELKTSLTNYFREYRRPQDDGKERDKQNRSIEGWVKRGAEFEFDLHFTNLSDVELGALIWLLKLPSNHFHRFGGGKPLGFGSVRLDLIASEITSGENLKKYYESLDGSLKGDPKAPEKCKEAFERAYQTAGYQNIVASFLRACEGFKTGLPTHYPRARHYKEVRARDTEGRWQTVDIRYVDEADNDVSHDAPVPPHTEGLAYEWFVENAKEKIEVKGRKEGQSVRIDLLPDIDEIRPRYALKNILEDDGLVILPRKKQENR